MPQVDFNTDILNNLLYEQPEMAITAQTQFPNINQWVNRKIKPTLNQLISLSHFFKIPFGYFFLEKLPKKEFPLPHYRTVADTPFHPSQQLVDTIQTLQERQQWARDLLIELREEPLPYAKSITIKTPVETASNQIKSILDLKDSWADKLPNWTNTLRVLIERAEKAGIFVVMNVL